MKFRKGLFLFFLVLSFTALSCKYIVLPEGLENPASAGEATVKGVWSAVVTNVSTSAAGALHVDVTLRNDTGDWSKMQSLDGKSARLNSGDGKTIDCETVFIGTGGHRLAPGFQMRGYTTTDQKIQPLFVECAGAPAGKGAKLSINYVSYSGILDDYDPEANKSEGVLDLKLDDVKTDLTYPIATQVDGLILPSGEHITGLSDNVVTLLSVERAENGFVFTWQNENPTKFPLKTHIGIPPVIGSSGILYGAYEIIDMAPVPVTPSNGKMEWNTEAAVPAEEKGFYILLSVESKKPRTYINYVLDITEH
jgi:hypothetical protein